MYHDIQVSYLPCDTVPIITIQEEVMEIRDTAEQKTAVIRTSTPVEKLSEVMGSCYGEIMQYLGPKGIQPVGPPFAVYHNMDMSNLDVEIGFPLAVEVEGNGRVNPGRIAGGKAAVTVHTGPYDKIGETYERLTAYVKEQGMETAGCCYEFYLNDPTDTAPEELKTEIHFPVT